eukprot:m.82186 g.82186  ORF g.82186 m.82186 type:complete len:551 (-) comp8108_c0_seq2:173-1825(-)
MTGSQPSHTSLLCVASRQTGRPDAMAALVRRLLPSSAARRTWVACLVRSVHDEVKPVAAVKLLHALEISPSGHTSAVQLSRFQILGMCGLVGRDIRFIDDMSSQIKPKILVRSKAIVVGIEHVRAIILSDRVLLFNHNGLWGRQLAKLLQTTLSGADDVFLDAPSTPVQITPSANRFFSHGNDQHLTRSLQLVDRFEPFDMDNFDIEPAPQNDRTSIPYLETIHNSDAVDHTSQFEFRVLESTLVSVTVALDMQLYRLSASVESVLSELSQKLSPATLQRLLLIKTGLTAFETQAREIKTCLRNILDDDDQMDAMYLSDPRTGSTLGDHDQAEALLETYANTLEQMCNEANRLLTTIRGTEEVMSITQDTMRNRIITLNLIVAGGAFAMSASTMITGIFGMNLDIPEFIMHANVVGLNAFMIVASTSFFILAATAALCMRYYRGQNIRMNLRGHTVVNSFVPYAEEIEDAMQRLGYPGRKLDFAQFRMLLEGVVHQRLPESEVRSLFESQDEGQEGYVDANRFLTLLKIHQSAFRHTGSARRVDFSVPEA